MRHKADHYCRLRRLRSAFSVPHAKLRLQALPLDRDDFEDRVEALTPLQLRAVTQSFAFVAVSAWAAGRRHEPTTGLWVGVSSVCLCVFSLGQPQQHFPFRGWWWECQLRRLAVIRSRLATHQRLCFRYRRSRSAAPSRVDAATAFLWLGILSATDRRRRVVRAWQRTAKAARAQRARETAALAYR